MYLSRCIYLPKGGIHRAVHVSRPHVPRFRQPWGTCLRLPFGGCLFSYRGFLFTCRVSCQASRSVLSKLIVWRSRGREQQQGDGEVRHTDSVCAPILYLNYLCDLSGSTIHGSSPSRTASVVECTFRCSLECEAVYFFSICLCLWGASFLRLWFSLL